MSCPSGGGGKYEYSVIAFVSDEYYVPDAWQVVISDGIFNTMVKSCSEE